MTTPKKFLNDYLQEEGFAEGLDQIALSTTEIESLLASFAKKRIEEEREKNERPFVANVKNINCDFGELRDYLSEMKCGIELDKDTFVFVNCTKGVYERLCALKDFLKLSDKHIIISKP